MSEVIGRKVIDKPVFPERRDDSVSGRLVIQERAFREFAGGFLPLFLPEEPIAEGAEREPIGILGPGGPAGVQVISLRLVQFQGFLPAVAGKPLHTTAYYRSPSAEIVNF